MRDLEWALSWTSNKRCGFRPNWWHSSVSIVIGLAHTNRFSKADDINCILISSIYFLNTWANFSPVLPTDRYFFSSSFQYTFQYFLVGKITRDRVFHIYVHIQLYNIVYTILLLLMLLIIIISCLQKLTTIISNIYW